MLDIGAERIVDGGFDCVGAAAAEFLNQIADFTDDVAIIAGAAGHRVIAGIALQRVFAGVALQRIVGAAAQELVIAGIAGDDVRQRVAGAVDIGGAQQREVLDIGEGGDAIGDRRLDFVDIHACLDDLVGGVIDKVRVAAVAAGHAVDTGGAVEIVGADAAGQRVGIVAAIDRVIAIIAAQ